MAKVKLSQAVSYALDEMNYGDAEYARAYRFAIRALDDLNLDITGEITREVLCVNNDLTVDLPDNFIKETRVGVYGQNGKIIGLTRSNNLTSNIYCDTSDDSNPVYYTSDEHFGGFVNQSLGRGSYTNIGFFNIDYTARKIYLNAEFTYSEIVIEYLKREEVDGEYCIDERLLEAVAAYIRWKWSIAKKGTSIGERREYERLWHKEKENAKYRIKRPMLQDFNRDARESVKEGIKI